MISGDTLVCDEVAALVLTHLIPEPSTAELMDQYVRNIRAGGFIGELLVADDLDTVTLGAVPLETSATPG